MEQNYLIVQNNVVTNSVVWDGNAQTWQPPADAVMLIQSITPALVWQSNGLIPPSWVLTEVLGAGSIGFTWNGSVLTTNQPEPAPQQAASNQPNTTGTTTI